MEDSKPKITSPVEKNVTAMSQEMAGLTLPERAQNSCSPNFENKENKESTHVEDSSVYSGLEANSDGEIEFEDEAEAVVLMAEIAAQKKLIRQERMDLAVHEEILRRARLMDEVYCELEAADPDAVGEALANAQAEMEKDPEVVRQAFEAVKAETERVVREELVKSGKL